MSPSVSHLAGRLDVHVNQRVPLRGGAELSLRFSSPRRHSTHPSPGEVALERRTGPARVRAYAL